MSPLTDIGAGRGNRTLVFSLEDCSSAIELYPHELAEQAGFEPARRLATSFGLANRRHQPLGHCSINRLTQFSAPCAASQLRKGQTRGKKTVFSQNSGTPGALVDGGVAAIGHLDLNGQGVITLAKDGEGKTVITANKQVGEPGPSIVLDAKDDCIFLTAGETQLKIRGRFPAGRAGISHSN